MTTDAEFPEVTAFDGGPKELREAYDRLRKAHKQLEKDTEGLRGEVRGSRIAAAGFPEGSKAYKQLTQHYTGDLSDREAIVAYAADEYGYEPEGSEPAPAAAAPPAGAEGETRLRAVAAAGQSLAGPVKGQADQLLAEIAKADAEGRVEDAVRLRNMYSETIRKG